MGDGDRTRRRVLRTLGITATVGLLSGCSGNQEEAVTSRITTETNRRTPVQPQTRKAPATDAEPATVQEEPVEQTATPRGQRRALLGERIDGPKLSIIVKDFRWTDSIAETTARGSEKFLVVDAAVKNTTASEFLSFDDLFEPHLVDERGFSYDRRYLDAGDPMIALQIAPGEVLQGNFVFRMPGDATVSNVRFDVSAPGTLNARNVFVDLQSEAPSVGSFDQSLELRTFPLGKTLSRGGISVTPHNVRYRKSLARLRPGPGNYFMMVDLEMENGTNRDLQMDAPIQTAMKDGRGRRFEPETQFATKLTDAFHLAREIPAGGSKRGAVVYKAPIDPSVLYWVFEFEGLNDSNKAFWKIPQ